MLEDLAIEMSGKMRFRKLTKHVGRVSNDLITGECDVLDLAAQYWLQSNGQSAWRSF